MVRSNSTRVRGWTARVAIAAALVCAIPSIASARTELIRWSHPDAAAVSGYKVYVGTSSGSYTSSIDAGPLTPDANGVMSVQISVPDTATVYVVVTAYDAAGVESAYSNERSRSAPTGDTSGGGGSGGSGGSVGSGSIGPASDPVDPQATWSESFQQASPGNVAAGWVDTMPGLSLVPDDTLFSVIDLQGDHVLTTTSGAHDILSHWISPASANWNSYEYRGMMAVGSQGARIGVTAASQFLNAPIFYRLATQWGSGEFEIHGQPWDSATKSCTSKVTGVVPQAGAWYLFRFQVVPQAGSNLLRAKVWPHGTSEPSGWQAQCTDTSATRPTAGTVGVWSELAGTRYWDDLQIIPVSSGGTGGAPPSPLGAPGQPYLIFQ